MPISYVSNIKGDIVAVQIPIDEWYDLTEKYLDIEIGQQAFDIPQWQKDEILRREKYYEKNDGELLSWEEAT